LARFLMAKFIRRAKRETLLLKNLSEQRAANSIGREKAVRENAPGQTPKQHSIFPIEL